MTTATIGSQVYTSPIVLGEKYKDDRTGIEGHAVSLFFHQSGCVEVYLESMKEGADKPTRQFFPEQRLVPQNAELLKEYRSDIVLGRKYRDSNLGIEGIASMMEFWEHQSNRVSLKRVADPGGAKEKIIYHSIDDHHAVDIETQVQAREAEPGRRSPSPQTVQRDVRY